MLPIRNINTLFAMPHDGGGSVMYPIAANAIAFFGSIIMAQFCRLINNQFPQSGESGIGVPSYIVSRQYPLTPQSPSSGDREEFREPSEIGVPSYSKTECLCSEDISLLHFSVPYRIMQLGITT